MNWLAPACKLGERNGGLGTFGDERGGAAYMVAFSCPLARRVTLCQAPPEGPRGFRFDGHHGGSCGHR